MGGVQSWVVLTERALSLVVGRYFDIIGAPDRRFSVLSVTIPSLSSLALYRQEPGCVVWAAHPGNCSSEFANKKKEKLRGQRESREIEGRPAGFAEAPGR